MGWPIGLLIDASKGYPTDNNFNTGLNVQNTIIGGCKTPVAILPALLHQPEPLSYTSHWFNTSLWKYNCKQTDDVKLGMHLIMLILILVH